MRTVLTQTKLATVSFACYYRITRRRSGAGPPRNKCTPVYITHQMNAQRARLRPTYYSLATAGGANKIHSSTWVLSDTNRLATVQPHSAVHEQTASLQPHPKGLPINLKALNLYFSAVKSSRARNSKTEGVFDNSYGVACRRSLKLGADRAPGRRSGIRANLERPPRI